MNARLLPASRKEERKREKKNGSFKKSVRFFINCVRMNENFVPTTLCMHIREPVWLRVVRNLLQCYRMLSALKHYSSTTASVIIIMNKYISFFVRISHSLTPARKVHVLRKWSLSARKSWAKHRVVVRTPFLFNSGFFFFYFCAMEAERRRVTAINFVKMYNQIFVNVICRVWMNASSSNRGADKMDAERTRILRLRIRL